MIIYSISLFFVVQVWNIEFYQCLERVQIMLPVIEITRYQGDYTTSLYAYIVTTPVVQNYVYVPNCVCQKEGNSIIPTVC